MALETLFYSSYTRLISATWSSYFFAAFTAFVAWLVYKIVEEKLSPLARIPTPEGRLPLIGHLFVVLKKGGLQHALSDWRDKYGPMIAFNPGFGIGIGDCRIAVYDPNLIKQVMITESYKYDRPEFVKKMIPNVGNGLFGSSGKLHAKQRKLINPAFSYTTLKCFVPTFVENSAKLVKLWSKKIQTSPVLEVSEDICHLTLDIIGKTSFSYDFNSTLGTENEVTTAFNSLMSRGEFGYLVRKNVIPFYEYFPLPDNLAIKRSSQIVDGTVFKVIQERRMLRRQGEAADHKDLLNLLLDMYDEETGKGFDDEELRAQVFTFMLAGHETTSTSLSWTLYELAKRPEIQEKIRREIKEVLPDGEELTWNTLEKMQYLNSVAKESLRLRSPASLIGREANTTIQLGGYTVPKGTVLMVPVEAMHMSPKNWDNPTEFNPDRFMRNG
ncbi:taurochenodeoxycholic 6 alpha-hydroxylase-like [Actinia tenebrosa]|uniref:Taurochenodeoxycholic 6 alpha-hydroxylase-like n=1 Tax=Actinia tenebrosa TaxID=6105 RepID=A0A6P8IGN3_ACTTE|nr:taurochenodeoxycholic 6 alpha-hydroxylase-like [Actinia tenebrosa]